MKREMRKCSPTIGNWEVGKLEIQDMVSVMKQQYSDNQKTVSQQIQTRSNCCFLKKRKNGHLFQPFQAVGILQKLVDCWEDSNSPWLGLRCPTHPNSGVMVAICHLTMALLNMPSNMGFVNLQVVRPQGKFGNQLHSTQSIASKDDKHSYNVYPLFDIYHTEYHLP